MTPLTRAKLAFALIGLILFAAGVRFDSSRLRWIGIAFVAVAFFLRFVKSQGTPTDKEPND